MTTSDGVSPSPKGGTEPTGPPLNPPLLLTYNVPLIYNWIKSELRWYTAQNNKAIWESSPLCCTLRVAYRDFFVVFVFNPRCFSRQCMRQLGLHLLWSVAETLDSVFPGDRHAPIRYVDWSPGCLHRRNTYNGSLQFWRLTVSFPCAVFLHPYLAFRSTGRKSLTGGVLWTNLHGVLDCK